MSDKQLNPAFPSTNKVDCGGFATNGHPGMELRDYFAAKAMQVAWGALHDGYYSCGVDMIPSFVADRAYQIADAMLAERGE
jgi:hypothetical protein